MHRTVSSMTTAETTQQYEGAILNQLIKNAERLAVVEQDVSQLKTDVSQLKTDMVEVKSFIGDLKATLNWMKWFLGAITIGVLGNLLSQPILSVLHLN